MQKNEKILVLGARGLVGSAITRALKFQQYENILTPTSSELDLMNQEQTLKFFSQQKPDHVFNAAAHVGGIMANNTYRADFIFNNLAIQNNVFQACFQNSVKKLLFLGSSCIYPKHCQQPIKEEYLLTSDLEPTNEPYAIAKIAGLKTAESFRRQHGSQYYAVMPTNLYGINDNFHPEKSHVIPGLIQRMYETIKNKSTEFEIWGTGEVKREFLYVDDMSEACIHVMTMTEELPYWINVGTGQDIAIKDLATKIGTIMGYQGKYYFNTDKPSGTPRKVLDVSKINQLGWKSKVSIDEGLRKTIDYYNKLKLGS